MKRIKVLYVSQATGGVKRHIAFLASRLDPARFEIIGVFSPVEHIRGSSPNKETYFQLFKRLGLKGVPLEMYRNIHPWRDLCSFLRLLLILRKERPDILHTHSSKAGFLGRLAGRLMGVPVIVHTPNAFAFGRPGGSTMLDPLYKFLECWAGSFCDALIAVSPSEEELARQIIPSRKIVCIPNGIDLKEFEMPVDTVLKKMELGIPPEAPFVLSVGRLAPQKSPFDFISAAGHVLLKRPDVRFAFLGDGPLLEKAKQRIHRKRMERQMFLFDWREDSREIIASCDLFVLSSLWEGLPYALLEAMAFSKPTVVTDARGNRDVVLNGQTGLLVPLRDPGRLAEAILALVEDPERAQAMGRAGRRRVEEQFPINGNIQATTDLYERLLRQKGIC